MGEQTQDVDAVGAPDYADVDTDPAADVFGDSLDQPEDEATEHALRLMDEALRRDGAGWRWLVAGDP